MGKRAQPVSNVKYSKKTALAKPGRKARTTSGQHGAYVLGYTHPTMAKNNVLQASNSKLIT